jgi:hypothetical protein
MTDRGNPAVAGHTWVPMDDDNTMVYRVVARVSPGPRRRDPLGSHTT